MRRLHIFLLLIPLIFLPQACKQITSAADFITQPTPREKYARGFEDTLIYAQWEERLRHAMKDSVDVSLPYLENGRFWKDRLSAMGYDLTLNQGDVFYAQMDVDSLDPPIFLDLYRTTEDSINPYRFIAGSPLDSTGIEHTVERTGSYKLVIQPGIHAQVAFDLKIYRLPLYGFPVSGKGNAAVQSFWGARRDGGKRSHEGLDIFADRGTPVVAATDGFVSSTGDRGLGGKQVWLRAGLFGNSLYYAHLDSIIARRGSRVKRGDTLGLVGNTGNARTTPPHLHFGIYQGRGGAIDPLPYVFQESAPVPDRKRNDLAQRVTIASSTANLRGAAFAKAEWIESAKRGDTLIVLGKSKEWLHVRTKEDKAVFVHESLTRPITD